MIDRTAPRQRAYFPVARGLICSAHHDKIGSSVWVYLWILNHQTGNGGEVARCAPVTAATIGSYLDMAERTVQAHITKLRDAGYVTVESVGGRGMRLTITKPMVVAPASAGRAMRSAPNGAEIGGQPADSRAEIGGLTRGFQRADPRISAASDARLNLSESFEQKKENRMDSPAPLGAKGNGEPGWRDRVIASLRDVGTPATQRVLARPHPDGLNYALGMTLHSLAVQQHDPDTVADAILSVVDAKVHAIPPDPTVFLPAVFTRAVLARIEGDDTA